MFYYFLFNSTELLEAGFGPALFHFGGGPAFCFSGAAFGKTPGRSGLEPAGSVFLPNAFPENPGCPAATLPVARRHLCRRAQTF